MEKMFLEALTKNPHETQLVASLFAKELLRHRSKKHATVVALEGPLGSGKTTFLQGIGRGLGVRSRLRSPTFLIARAYTLPRKQGILWHLDCYRLQRGKELLALGIKEAMKDPSAIVVVEWAEKVKKILPRKRSTVAFRFGPLPDWRLLSIKITR